MIQLFDRKLYRPKIHVLTSEVSTIKMSHCQFITTTLEVFKNPPQQGIKLHGFRGAFSCDFYRCVCSVKIFYLLLSLLCLTFCPFLFLSLFLFNHV